MPVPSIRPAAPPPRITTRAEFVAALNAIGQDGEKLADGYRDWRVARGYLSADPLAGVTADSAPDQVYAAMDQATRKTIADGGDVGAMQAYAAGSLPADPLAAIEYYGRASRAGSATAMDALARLFNDLGAGSIDIGRDPAFADQLARARGAGPTVDLGQDAAAWTLAAIRVHGPLAASTDSVARLQYLADPKADPAQVATVCGRSLAILADLSASGAAGAGPPLPPAFLAAPDVYDRLPCRDTPAPVVPPRALERCTSSPALNGDGRPLLLWVCP